jgi:methionyl-tRNA synthetase
VITIDEFKRIELSIGEIVAAERIAGADRLLKLTVDVGHETRVLVGGLGAGYRPEELLGLKVVVATNLQPATIRGIVSEGMLLGASCGGPVPALLTVNRPVPNGTQVQ